MPANQTAAQRANAFGFSGPLSQAQQWDVGFLGDIGAPVNQTNMNALAAWQSSETGGGMPNRALFNLLATTQTEPGSYPINSAGVQAFTSMQQGEQANAQVLLNNPHDAAMLQALRAGNTTNQGFEAAMASGNWGTKPATFYANLQRGGGGPGGAAFPGTVGGLAGGLQGAIGATTAGSSAVLEQQLAAQNEGYARQETGFQQQLLGLSQQQLGIQRGALARQEKLVPEEYGITTREEALQARNLGISLQQLQQQRKDISRQSETERLSTVSQQAGSGTMFTGGGRRQISDIAANLKSQLLSNTLQQKQVGIEQQGLQLQRQQAGLTFREQMAEMQDEQKNLDILAKRYGISGQELEARLQNTIQNINIGAQQNVMLDLTGLMQGTTSGFLSLLAGGGLPLGAVTGGVGGG